MILNVDVLEMRLESINMCISIDMHSDAHVYVMAEWTTCLIIHHEDGR